MAPLPVTATKEVLTLPSGFGLVSLLGVLGDVDGPEDGC
jgi:hypothetical protein